MIIFFKNTDWQKFHHIGLFSVVLALAISSCVFSNSDNSPDKSATNIILFIGDGMGEEHRKAARWFLVGKTGYLSMDDMPANGLLATASYNSTITDSAAAATAMSTGTKTNNELVGLDPNLNSLSTILEDSKRAGKSVGLVTTTQITHATPAAFASHVTNRWMTNEIALQMLDSGSDILLGGGENNFLPVTEIGCFNQTGSRDDERNLISEAIASGYTYICNTSDFLKIDPNSTNKILGLFAGEGMTRPYSPSLAEMTQKAIDILSKNENGFFLMVEGGQIDWASHANDAEKSISDTLDLDEAVEIAKHFSTTRPSTLVIVTADHETGGMSVSLNSSGAPDEDGPFPMPDGDMFYINWSTTGHTGVDIPISAQGPFSELFSGTHENTFVHNVMTHAFELQ